MIMSDKENNSPLLPAVLTTDGAVSLFHAHKKDGSGFEGLTQAAFKLPFIKIMEALSPEVMYGAEHVENAKPGLFFNTATHELSETIKVVVLKVRHTLLAWAPKRGGFKGEFELAQESAIVVRTEREGFIKYDKDRNVIQETLTYFMLDANNMRAFAALPLSSTRLKDGKSFDNRLRYLKCNGDYTDVTWAGVWELGLVEKTNDQGTWHVIGNTPNFIRFVTEEEIINFILPAIEMIKERKVDYDDLHVGSEKDSAGDEAVQW